MGRDKIAALVWRESLDASVATVGRIIAELVGRGVVQSVPSLRKGTRHVPRKHKRTYAKRLPKDKKPTRPGEIVQVDTVHINLVPGKSIRHFAGYCPVAKWTVAEARNRATAAAASLFLDKLQADMPFTVEGIQVNGGSQFMAEFEAKCEKRRIRLYVLPPRSPKLTATSSAAMAPGATSSTPAPSCRAPSPSSIRSSTTGRTRTTSSVHTVH